MAKKTIFISYDYDNDKHYKDLLVEWDENKEFDFSFYDASVDESVDSTDVAAVKNVISEKISSATYFLCIIGESSHQSSWVKWEIEKAVELKRKLIGVKTDDKNTSPDAILWVGASWAMPFAYDAIKNTIEEASLPIG